jgi:hypothetical protein
MLITFSSEDIHLPPKPKILAPPLLDQMLSLHFCGARTFQAQGHTRKTFF